MHDSERVRLRDRLAGFEHIAHGLLDQVLLILVLTVSHGIRLVAQRAHRPVAGVIGALVITNLFADGVGHLGLFTSPLSDGAGRGLTRASMREPTGWVMSTSRR